MYRKKSEEVTDLLRGLYLHDGDKYHDDPVYYVAMDYAVRAIEERDRLRGIIEEIRMELELAKGAIEIWKRRPFG